MHVYHDGSKILYDDCLDCEHHADHPFDYLDNENLKALRDMATQGEKGRTFREQIAIRQIIRATEIAERLKAL